MAIRLGFMTSVAPDWDLSRIIAEAKTGGYQCLEPRVGWNHGAGIELELSKSERREIKHRLDDAGLTISALALGARFAQSTQEERAESIELTARAAELASDLGTPYLRVFGGPLPGNVAMIDIRDSVAEALGAAARRAAAFGVTPCLETHDDFNHPDDVAYVVSNCGEPNAGVVWHAGHHLRLGVSVADGYRTLAPWIRHCHTNGLPMPAIMTESERAACSTGDANVTAEVVRILAQHNYDGVISWEWLNGRGAEYIDPSPLLPEYAAKLREYLSA
ncbi:MAG: sugar phosphate isomerase/epimerase family protein [Thermomicrobiales bacterium]